MAPDDDQRGRPGLPPSRSPLRDKVTNMAGGVMEKRSHPGQTSRAGTTHAAASTFASAWRRAHLTVDERLARGRDARKEAPRSSHGRWTPAPDRPDPIALLEEQAETRVPSLVPIRY